MSYDPTERAPQPPGAPPPAYGQSNPDLPPYGQAPQAPNPQVPATPPYGQAPIQPTVYSQGNPASPAYGQGPQGPISQTPTPPPAYGQSNPYGQGPVSQTPAPPPAYGQGNPYGQGGASSPSYPPYGQGGASSPSYPPYAQQQQVDPYAPTPGQQYQSGQQWGASTPPAYPPQVPVNAGIPPAYPPSAPAQKKGGGLKIALIVLIVVILVGGGGGGTAIYFATRPKPVITVKSDYKVGDTFAGASSTAFTFTGHDFTGSSTVTFLLDGAPAPGTQPVQSDSKGDLTATLTVTDAWSVGNHTITAKDAAGYLTQTGLAITVVQPGQAHTPGPHGAPSDDATITINANVQAGSSSGAITLDVTSGKVCATRDDGQPHTSNGSNSDGTYTETIVQTCSGTYGGGKLTYTETTTSDKIVFTGGSAQGVICTANTPFTSAHMEGAFSSATSISGNYSDGGVTVVCSLNGASNSNTVAPQNGTWTGDATVK